MREDRRHIQDKDVYALRPLLSTRMNLECAITNEMIAIACEVKPHDICLVPERRQELTTEGGLNVLASCELVKTAVSRLHDAGSRVSLFIDPDFEQIHAAAEAGATVIELHTGTYSEAPTEKKPAELERLRLAVAEGIRAGLKVNAGHGLNYDNVQPIVALGGISELNIGHAIVAQSIFDGWEKAVRDMKALLR